MISPPKPVIEKFHRHQQCFKDQRLWWSLLHPHQRCPKRQEFFAPAQAEAPAPVTEYFLPAPAVIQAPARIVGVCCAFASCFSFASSCGGVQLTRACSVSFANAHLTRARQCLMPQRQWWSLVFLRGAVVFRALSHLWWQSSSRWVSSSTALLVRWQG